MSDDRLRENLRKADVAVANLDRTSLQAAWAELVATGRDKPVAAAVTYTDPEDEQQKLQSEEHKFSLKLFVHELLDLREHSSILTNGVTLHRSEIDSLIASVCCT